ncbi:hypothetical protein [Streptomyces malaysiensis]|uniref:hypothetical protein n=1 Tax=Streptomyces malaysiensis TaxID=92644 RepID=UPI0033DCB7E8
MSQVIAAAIGALVAMAGTVGAGWLAYKASRQQVGDNGYLEHARTLRQERRETYLATLVVYHQVQRALETFERPDGTFVLPASREAYRETARQLDALRQDFAQQWYAIELVGPNSVRPTAGDMYELIREVYYRVEGIATGDISLSEGEYWDDASDLQNQLFTASEDFAREARLVLEKLPEPASRP